MDGGELNKSITRAQEGDQRAFNVLFDTHWEYVFGFLFQRTQNEQLADELAVEAFTKAFDNIQSYKHSYSFKTWLITIAKNNQIDQIRKTKKNPIPATENLELLAQHHERVSPSPEDLLIQNQQSEKLLHCIKSLPKAYKTILQLRYFEDLNYTQIEKKLNLSPNLVKVRLFRAKKMLAQALIDDTL